MNLETLGDDEPHTELHRYETDAWDARHRAHSDGYRTHTSLGKVKYSKSSCGDGYRGLQSSPKATEQRFETVEV